MRHPEEQQVLTLTIHEWSIILAALGEYEAKDDGDDYAIEMMNKKIDEATE